MPRFYKNPDKVFTLFLNYLYFYASDFPAQEDFEIALKEKDIEPLSSEQKIEYSKNDPNAAYAFKVTRKGAHQAMPWVYNTSGIVTGNIILMGASVDPTQLM